MFSVVGYYYYYFYDHGYRVPEMRAKGSEGTNVFFNRLPVARRRNGIYGQGIMTGTQQGHLMTNGHGPCKRLRSCRIVRDTRDFRAVAGDRPGGGGNRFVFFPRPLRVGRTGGFWPWTKGSGMAVAGTRCERIEETDD